MSKIKSCPSCRGESLLHQTESLGVKYQIKCEGCWIQTRWLSDKNEAIATWNKRPDNLGTLRKDQDLYLEFGDGNILVLTTEDNKIILSKKHGQGEIGKEGPIEQGDEYYPSDNDVVMKFKNIESLLVLKEAIESIENDWR